MNRRNQDFKTLAEKKQELANLKVKWKEMKKQEKELKEKFYSSPFEKRAKIKRELEILQDAIFEKRDCGTSMRIDTRNEELFERLKNPTGQPTNPQHLANLIKEELRAILNGSRKLEVGDRVGDIWESNHGKEICYFGQNKEIKEGIVNLARNRQEPLDPEKMTSRMVRVKQSDFSSADFNEMISLTRQVKNFLEEKDKQERQKTETIKLNNPHLFTQSKCSTDGKYNGRGRWENWHTFSGKHHGFNYTIYVPDEHLALTNVLFDNGWGTNSEVSKFFVVEGAAKPTTLHYWNVAKQKDEIVSETEAQRLIKQDKENYIKYKTHVDLSDEIMIDHYQENGQQDLTKPISGTNKLIKNSNHKNTSGGVVEYQGEEANRQLDKEFLLKFFQEHDIKQISLTPERSLLIEYNSGKSEIKTSGQSNNQELQKIINYCQKTSQNNLNHNDLINMTSTNPSSTKSPTNNAILISCGIGLILIVGIGIGLIARKKKNKGE